MIEVERVEKRFVVRAKRGRLRRERREVAAVDGISFEIERGAIVGYVGPNGAGKSTTVKMLTGILVPSGGPHPRRRPRPVAAAHRARTPDRRRLRPALAALVGPAARATPSSCCGTSTACPTARHRENLDALRRACSALGAVPRDAGAPALARPADARRADRCAPARSRDRLPRRADDRARRRREGAVREFLAEVNRERGVTVLLTTHDLADIERLCSRLLIIDHGRLIWDGGLDELKRQHGQERTLVVDLEEPAPPLEVPGARVVRVDGPRQWLAFRRDETSAAELTAAVGAQARLLDLAIEETDIEEIVRRIYAAGEPVAAPEQHADRHADRVDRDVERRADAPGDEDLMHLVRDRVGDSRPRAPPARRGAHAAAARRARRTRRRGRSSAARGPTCRGRCRDRGRTRSAKIRPAQSDDRRPQAQRGGDRHAADGRLPPHTYGAR